MICARGAKAAAAVCSRREREKNTLTTEACYRILRYGSMSAGHFRIRLFCVSRLHSIVGVWRDQDEEAKRSEVVDL